MSSSLRFRDDIGRKFPTKLVGLSTPSYYDNNKDADVPIPFIVNNGVLDINIQDNVVNDLIEDSYNNGPESNPTFRCKPMGGISTVNSIGPHFEAYLRDLIGYAIFDDGFYNGSLSIDLAPVMTKIQIAQVGRSDDYDTYEYGTETTLDNEGYQSWGVSYTKPSSSELVYQGSDADNWSTAWIFKTPLVIKFEDIGGPRPLYLTFCSKFEYH